MGIRARSAKGTTLIEAMVVVAILGVIAALAVPRLLPLVRDTEGRTDAETIASFLDGAHRRAIAEGRCFRVRVVANQLVLERRSGGDCVNLAADSWSGTLEHVGAARGTTVAIDVLPAGAAEIIFRPSGRLRGNGDLIVANDAARVKLTRTDVLRTRSVLVTPAGRICSFAHPAAPPALTTPAVCP